MEEEKFGFSHEEEIKQVVQRFETMKRNNENYFFDVIEFETIIDYYLESNNSLRAFEAAALATSQHPNSVSIQLRKARVLLDRGRAVEAMRILKKLEDIEPGNHEIYIVKGTALGILGDINASQENVRSGSYKGYRRKRKYSFFNYISAPESQLLRTPDTLS